MEDKGKVNRGLRSDLWFGDQVEPGEAAVYLERYGNHGITREELQSGRPVIGIAQSGSDLVPCNRIHVTLAERVKAGIRDAGGLPFEFPTHPSRRRGAGPPAPLTATLPTLAWLRSWPDIRSMALCSRRAATRPLPQP